MTRQGAQVSFDDVGRVCGSAEPVSCVHQRGYDREFAYFHPPSRYWRFQWTEVGLLLAGTVLLGGVVAYRVVRRPV